MDSIFLGLYQRYVGFSREGITFFFKSVTSEGPKSHVEIKMIFFQSYFREYLEHHGFVTLLLQSQLNENIWILNNTSECLLNNEVQPCIISLIRYCVSSSLRLYLLSL